MSHGVAKFTQSDAGRIFKAARKAGVDVTVEFRPDGIIVATTGKAATVSAADEKLSVDDELEQWRRKKSQAVRRRDGRLLRGPSSRTGCGGSAY